MVAEEVFVSCYNFNLITIFKVSYNLSEPGPEPEPLRGAEKNLFSSATVVSDLTKNGF